MKRLTCGLLLLVIVTIAAPSSAQPPATPFGGAIAPKPGTTNAPAEARSRPVIASKPTPTDREIYIPFEDLKTILASGTERIFMSREQYADLLKKANVKPGTLPPQNSEDQPAFAAGGPAPHH